ncbi:leucine-rich repeat-containing protein let-4-like [Metopolophium dirhodum]|uniref:leucine-rich repeat-containing protein let-4-like n=1 Tax=Metopolophium dirhodum TaxID=44670 RepID=UPI0029902F51|nr:leucine-rich repeat-containing protein let-4-like [Metopolophium dirhodum]
MISQVMQALTVLCALFIASASATLCPHPCKCFTTENGIQVANCTDLPDQMTTAWPQKILRIHFETDRASTVMLKNKAFKHFPRLTYLDITGGTIHYVGILAFYGLPELVELNLVGTGIRKLHRNTFTNNRKLAFLSLSKNPRLFVGPSFLVSESITELDLSECGLTTLKSVYFKSLPNLKYLFATKNQIKSLGSQFGPSGVKFVNLAHNQIEYINEDLEAYKRLKTIDLTGNPVNCTCELSEIDKKLSSRGVAFGNSITCNNTGKPLGDMFEVCSDKEMMGDDPMDIYQADHLLKIEKSEMHSFEEIDDSGSGSGSGDSEPTVVYVKTTVQTEMENEKNNTQIDEVKNNTQVEEVVFTKARVVDTFIVPKIETTSVEPITTTVEVSSKDKTDDTTILPNEEVMVHVQPSVNPLDGNSSTMRSSMDRGIVSQTIQAQAPEDEDNVQTQVAEFLKSNVYIAGTAAILLIVIVAIVYKAVCLGKSQSHSIVSSNDKSVELKDIKYEAANTEDTRDDSPASSVEENLLGDHDSDDEDDSSGPNEDDALSSSPVTNGHAQNGLLNSVMDAVKNNEAPTARTTPGGQDVPTRVIVKLCETPKASKPITINNVH